MPDISLAHTPVLVLVHRRPDRLHFLHFLGRVLQSHWLGLVEILCSHWLRHLTIQTEEMRDIRNRQLFTIPNFISRQSLNKKLEEIAMKLESDRVCPAYIILSVPNILANNNFTYFYS